MGVVSIGNARARIAPPAPRRGGPVVWPVQAPAGECASAILPALVLLLAGCLGFAKDDLTS